MTAILPNVVLCMCDQLRAFEVGCYGNPVVQTPNLDQLAKGGGRFDIAVANNPVCMPSRSSLLTGQHSRTCWGRLDNYSESRANGTVHVPEYPVRVRSQLLAPTLAEQFKAAGYETALVGKWHIHPAPDLLGFDHALYPFVHHRNTGQTYIENDAPPRVVDGFGVKPRLREPGLDRLGLVAEPDHELAEAGVPVVSEQVPEDRLAVDRHQRLRLRLGLLDQSRPHAASKNRDLHREDPRQATGHTNRDQSVAVSADAVRWQ